MKTYSGGVVRNILIETTTERMHVPTPLPPLDAATLRQKAAQRRREADAFARHIPRVERESDAYKIRWHRQRVAELRAEADTFDRRAAALEGDTQ